MNCQLYKDGGGGYNYDWRLNNQLIKFATYPLVNWEVSVKYKKEKWMTEKPKYEKEKLSLTSGKFWS